MRALAPVKMKLTVAVSVRGARVNPTTSVASRYTTEEPRYKFLRWSATAAPHVGVDPRGPFRTYQCSVALRTAASTGLPRYVATGFTWLAVEP